MTEHPEYTLQDWLNQVNSGYSILGYWSWVAEQSEQAKVVETIDLCPDCKQPLRAKGLYEGGGVECTSEDCGYWFCF